LGIIFLIAVLLITLDNQGKVSLRYLLPAIILSSIGSLYPWIALNSRDASAERLEDLIDMNRDLILPNYSQSGYENLRKFHLNRHRADDRIRVMLKMVSTHCQSADNLFEIVEVIGSAPTEAQADRYMQQTLPLVVEYLDESYPRNDYRFVEDAERSDDVASMMLLIHSKKPSLVPGYIEYIDRSVPDWSMSGFVHAAIDTQITARERAAGMLPYVRDSTTNSHLLAMMGSYLNKAGRYREALNYLRKSVNLEPSRTIGSYALMAKIHAQAFADIDSSILCMREGLQNCPLSPSYSRYLKLLKKLETYRKEHMSR
jgi:hypothetical protein